MSIGPIESFSLSDNSRSVNPGADSRLAEPRPAPAAPQQSPAPVSGTVQNQQKSPAKTAAQTYELPQDVVEVHPDPQDKGQVIIQYLDHANNVILQVPSQEELNVERGIAQEFQQAAKLRASHSDQAKE
jgi:hypothetical protein